MSIAVFATPNTGIHFAMTCDTISLTHGWRLSPAEVGSVLPDPVILYGRQFKGIVNVTGGPSRMQINMIEDTLQDHWRSLIIEHSGGHVEFLSADASSYSPSIAAQATWFFDGTEFYSGSDGRLSSYR